jgi:hypothetical protein
VRVSAQARVARIVRSACKRDPIESANTKPAGVRPETQRLQPLRRRVLSDCSRTSTLKSGTGFAGLDTGHSQRHRSLIGNQGQHSHPTFRCCLHATKLRDRSAPAWRRGSDQGHADRH